MPSRSPLRWKLRLRRPLAEGRTPAELRAAIASAAEETDRLTQLSEDLLSTAQTERGERPLRLGRVELDALLGGVQRRFTTRADEAGRQIVIETKRLEVTGDRLRRDQMVGSIVDNTLRYRAGTVKLEARSVVGAIEIAITDEENGFPPEDRPW